MAVFGYSLDQPQIIAGIKEARGQGAKLQVAVDFGQTKGRSKQVHAVKDLVYAGVPTYLVEGVDIRPKYKEFGEPCGVDVRGSLHAKSFRVGYYFYAGSTNWSISSRANCELGMLVFLEAAKMRERRVAEAVILTDANKTSAREIDMLVETTDAGRPSRENREDFKRRFQRSQKAGTVSF